MTALLGRYLHAIGVAGDAPSGTILARLLKAHLTAFPYETLGMGLGDPYPLDPEACVLRALDGRPGYCYTQNTAFAWVLERLGFAVTRHLGVVTGRSKPEPERVTGGHLALTVRLNGQDWLADAGLGPGPIAPLPLIAGPVACGPFTHRLEPSPVPGADWRLTPDPHLGAFRYMDFAGEPAPHEAFLPLHEERRHVGTAGAPYFCVQRPSPDGVHMLIGCAYTEVRGATEPTRTTVVLRDAAAWSAQVHRLGCRALEGRGPGVIEALHSRLVREHDVFSATAPR